MFTITQKTEPAHNFCIRAMQSTKGPKSSMIPSKLQRIKKATQIYLVVNGALPQTCWILQIGQVIKTS